MLAVNPTDYLFQGDSQIGLQSRPYFTIEQVEAINAKAEAESKASVADLFTEEGHKKSYDEAVSRAEQLLGSNRGYESVLEYITDAHSRGIMLSSASLRELWDEFWSYHRDEEIENETNDMIEANA